MGKRSDWKISATRKRLAILVYKKRKLVILYYRTKKYAWPEVADHIKQATVYRPSATQCEENFYSLEKLSSLLNGVQKDWK